MVGHSDILGLLESVSVQNLCPVVPRNSDYFFSPNVVTLVKGYRSLCRGLGEGLTVLILVVYQGPSSRGPSLPFIKAFLMGHLGGLVR